MKPDIGSPGVNVVSAHANSINGYMTMSGTSMATPFVAGVALLIRDASPGLTTQQVKDLMMSTAVDWGRGGNNRTPGTTGADTDYGAGRLDADAALKAAGQRSTARPPGPFTSSTTTRSRSAGRSATTSSPSTARAIRSPRR